MALREDTQKKRQVGNIFSIYLKTKEGKQIKVRKIIPLKEPKEIPENVPKKANHQYIYYS